MDFCSTSCTNADGAEQFEMKKQYVYERMMHSPMMSLLASVGSSESPTSPVSSQSMLYRRLKRMTTMTFVGISGSWSIWIMGCRGFPWVENRLFSSEEYIDIAYEGWASRNSISGKSPLVSSKEYIDIVCIAIKATVIVSNARLKIFTNVFLNSACAFKESINSSR